MFCLNAGFLLQYFMVVLAFDHVSRVPMMVSSAALCLEVQI